MMIKNAIVKGLSVLLFLITVPNVVYAAPPGSCQGPNKNDPGCPGNEVVVAVVDSVTVDWLNEKLTVRGSGFTGSTTFVLGSTASLTPINVTDTELDIPFSSDIALEVMSAGNYNLLVDGAAQLSVYIESQVIDPAATTCPCTGDWRTALGGLWGPNNTECVAIEGPGSQDIADISGTVQTNPADSTVYPLYPIGASYYPDDPNSSVCRLVQVNVDATTTELVNMRLNEAQQADCAVQLKANICTP